MCGLRRIHAPPVFARHLPQSRGTHGRFPVRFQRQWRRRHGRRRRRRRSTHRRCTTHSLEQLLLAPTILRCARCADVRRRTRAMWLCTLLQQLCWHSRVYGQWLPDMPQSYQDGAAPVQLNFWTIVARRGSVKTNSTCVWFLTMHTRTFFKHTDYACSAAYEQLSFSLYLQCYCICIHFLSLFN